MVDLTRGATPGTTVEVSPNRAAGPVWLPAIKEAGVAPLRPHDLRHTAVSLWIAAGASPKQIAVWWAGHTSVSIVLDRYGHLFPGNAEPVLERLEALSLRGEVGDQT